MEWDTLVNAAWDVRQRAYAPYSNFPVGAAVLAADGRIFAGCNVENLSYGLTQCAERVAVGMAVAAGACQLVAIAVVADTLVHWRRRLAQSGLLDKQSSCGVAAQPCPCQVDCGHAFTI